SITDSKIDSNNAVFGRLKTNSEKLLASIQATEKPWKMHPNMPVSPARMPILLRFSGQMLILIGVTCVRIFRVTGDIVRALP
ncbi:MAG TPA: hypothetical protein VH164_02570, partial [Ktedonobacteraceae bacterium]|nr:hypothetical protein [Ktedonobacteraceae bacterium]